MPIGMTAGLWLRLQLHPSILIQAERVSNLHIEKLAHVMAPFTYDMHWYGRTEGVSPNWLPEIERFIDARILPELPPRSARVLEKRGSPLREHVYSNIGRKVFDWAEAHGMVRELGGPWNDRRPTSADENPRRPA